MSESDRPRLSAKAIEKIREALATKRWNQAALAAAIGATPDRISKWLGGTGMPGNQDLLKLARSIDLDMEYLCDDALEVPPLSSLSERGRHLLEAAQILGYEEAMRRLLVAGGVVDDQARARIPLGPLIPGEEKSPRR